VATGTTTALGRDLHRPAETRADVVAAAIALLLVAAAVITAFAVPTVTGVPSARVAAPLFASWLPHVGPGTPVVLLLAAAVIWHGPALAARLGWRGLLGAAYVAAVGWTVALALVDGWARGFAGRLTTPHEYLAEVPGVTDVPATLRGFTARILDFQPDSWTTHVAGHPPGALLVFVGLDRIGLGGGGWAALVCVLVGASVAVSVPMTVRFLGTEDAARAAVPFLVLFPGAVWTGVSADGLFTGVTAAGIAVLAASTTRDGVAGKSLAALAGLILGVGCYLSYGLVLMALPALAVLVAVRRLAPLLWAAAGAATVVAAFTLAGFWWLDGYHTLVDRYYQGIAGDRPYRYWVWANLACLTLSAGPAMAPVLRRLAVSRFPGHLVLPGAAAVAMVVADVSGMSKAEVERIWLPFAVWLPAAAALLPAGSRRGWLAAQALTAVVVNHLLLTVW
jgi:methylthioxylose transferase